MLRLRGQRARNFMALLLLSQGVPMLTAGDEVLRTQRGNNNAYCQDNDVSWLDWSFAPAARAMLRFTRELIALRKRHPSLRRTRFLNGDGQATSAEIHWYGESLEPPAWADPEARVLCFTLAGVAPQEPALHVMINMASTVRNLPLPERGGASLAPDRRHDVRCARRRRAGGRRGAGQPLPARAARYRHLRGQSVRGRVTAMKHLLLAMLALLAVTQRPTLKRSRRITASRSASSTTPTTVSATTCSAIR